MAKSRVDLKTKIAETALKLAAQQFFASLSLDDIAKSAKLPVTDVHATFTSTRDILVFLTEDNTRHTLAVLSQSDKKASLHDRLFEAIMARFDRLQAARASYVNLMKESRQHPDWALSLSRPLFAGMKVIAQRVCPTETPLRQNLIAMGLLAIYFSTLCVWRRDTAPDLTQTMASLDRHLRRNSILAEMIFR